MLTQKIIFVLYTSGEGGSIQESLLKFLIQSSTSEELVPLVDLVDGEFKPSEKRERQMFESTEAEQDMS